jgi:hypothetical protein
MGDVEPDHGHVEAAAEYGLCRLGVGPVVELRGRSDIALRDCRAPGSSFMPPPPFSVLPIMAVKSRRVPAGTPSISIDTSRWR